MTTSKDETKVMGGIPFARQKNPHYETAAEFERRAGIGFRTMPRATHTSLWLFKMLAATPVMQVGAAGYPS